VGNTFSLRDWKAWQEYVGVQTRGADTGAPKSRIDSVKHVGNVFQAFFGGMAGIDPDLRYEYEYKSDFSDMTVQKDGRVILPICRVKFTKHLNVSGYK